MSDQVDAGVQLERLQEGIARLTLNQPQTRNSLSQALLEELEQALHALAQDAQVRVVILAAAGNTFCAGHNLKEIHQQFGATAQQRALFEQCSQVMQAIVQLPQPVIAQVQGVATAAGCQLVASCDLAVAAESSRYATPGVHIGLFCSTPMVALTRNLGPKAAMEMLLTGDLISAERAQQLGLVNRVVADEALSEATLQLAQQLASKSAKTLALGKEAFYRQLHLPLAEAYAYTSEVMTQNLELADAQEGIRAFLEKRPPVWQGH